MSAKLYSKSDVIVSSLKDMRDQYVNTLRSIEDTPVITPPAVQDTNDDVTAQLNDKSSQTYAMIQDAIARQRLSGGNEAVSVSLPVSNVPGKGDFKFKPTPTSFRFYVGKKGEKRLMFDSLPVVPTAKTLTSRDFKTAYAKQLHDTLYTSEEEVNFAAMVSLISVYDHAVAMNGKVALSSAKYIYRMRDITAALSHFFTEHKQVISSIATMVNNRVQDV